MILEIFIIATITLAFQSSLTTELCITIIALLIKIKYYESDILGIYTPPLMLAIIKSDHTRII